MSDTTTQNEQLSHAVQRTADTTVQFVPPKQVIIMGLPDAHYNKIKKLVRKHGATTLRDNTGKATEFYFDNGKMMARSGDAEPQEVMPLSEASKPSQETSQLRGIIESRNPGVAEEVVDAALDILEEGIRTTKKLVEMGVPLDKARMIVGAALKDETGDVSIINEALLHHLSGKSSQPLPPQLEAQETAPPKDCE